MAIPKGRVRNVIATLVILACIIFVFAGIARDFNRVQLDAIEWDFVARAAVALLGAYVLRALAFSVLLRTMDPDAPILTAGRVFLASQLGRYIPGKVWQVAGAGYFASQFGISAAASLVGTAYYIVIHNLIGGLLGLWVILRLSAASQSINSVVAVLGVGTLVVAFASSPAFTRLIQWVGKKTGRDLQVKAIPVWAVFVTVASSLCVWGLFGIAVVDVFRGVLPGSPAPDLLSAITNMAAASVAGLAVLIVPSGLGVREAVFVAAFSGSHTLTEGGVVALVLRVLMSVIELVLSALSIMRTGSGFRAT
jgi:hypothetical protein